jgi:DNA-binding response OmpR family regulator
VQEPTILVVDDQLINIRLLERKLTRSGMQVITSTNGPEAIETANSMLPDVILLDIMMPGMSGIEVCRRLKEADATKEIPVIFITAQTSKEGKIEGLDVGAADYLIKPIDLDETIARVRTQIRIVHEHRENLRLTQQLEQSRKQASIMHLTEGIAHNLNNLLGVMIGYTALLRRQKDNPDKIVQSSERLEAAIKRMTGIVHQLTVIGHFKSLQTRAVRIDGILHNAISRFQRMGSTDAPVEIDASLEPEFTMITNRELLEGTLERLLLNAYESYEQKDGTNPGGKIVMEAHSERMEGRDWLRLRVLDRGKGVDPDIRDGAFEPFVTSSSVIGRGMGLTIARHSVSCLRGSIDLRERVNGGTEVTILLPLDLEVDEDDNDATA